MITIKGINKVKMSVWNSNLITSREWKGRIMILIFLYLQKVKNTLFSLSIFPIIQESQMKFH